MENATTYREMLTPKNVYRFLTDNLPGLYPQGVIPAADRKGMTLVKFWSQVLEGVIPAQWQTSLFGGSQRSRRLSDLMNRTGGQPLPPRLEQEMNALLSGELLVRLSQRMQDFLRGVHYAPEALTRALPGFVKMMSENEEYWTLAHERVFRDLAAEEDVPRTFRDCLTLAWLALLAFYGTEMAGRALTDFCRGQEHSARALYLLSSHVTFGRRVPLSMTGRNCELCRQGLSAEEYIIDEGSCLPQLEEAIRRGGKIAVTGMGGIGKTEMTRQALSALSGEELFSRLAWVQYDGSLTASFRAAFEGLDGVAEENVLQTVREQVEAPYQGRTLLLIDSIDVPPEADAGLRELEHWDCDVLVTTRFPLGEGFRNIAVPLLSMASSRALFARHDPYVQDMGGEDALTQLLQRVEGHPLAIILLARLAKMKRWTMETLLTELDRVSPEGLRLSGGKFSDIAQQIAQMVSTDALTDRERQVLAVFATFPAWTIPVRETLSLLRDFGTEDELTSALETAADYGLLTSTWRGYAMHPVLSESFRGLLPPLEKMPRLPAIFVECRARFHDDTYLGAPLLSLALNTVSAYPDVSEEMMENVALAVTYVSTNTREFLSDARLKRWWAQLLPLHEQTERGRFLIWGLKIVMDGTFGGNYDEDVQQLVENLGGARTEDAQLLLCICTMTMQTIDRMLMLKLIERGSELVQVDDPFYEAFHSEMTIQRILIEVPVTQEEEDSSIAYYLREMDKPRSFASAAGKLCAMLSIMIQKTSEREKIKALADQMDQKMRKMEVQIPACDHGLSMVYRQFREYDKAKWYAERALSQLPEGGLNYVYTLHNYITIMQESGKRVETAEILEKELPKIKERYGEDSTPYCLFMHSYSSVLIAMHRPTEALEALDKLLPLVEKNLGAMNAKVATVFKVMALAQLGHEEEAKRMATELRAFFVEHCGEDFTGVQRCDEILQKIDAGEYRKERAEKEQKPM